MGNTRKTVAIVALALVFAVPAVAEEITGRQVMEKLDKFNRASDEIVKGTMEVVPANKLLRTLRKITSYMKANMENDDDRTVIRFVAPEKYYGVGLLTVEHGSSDDQWLHLPELRKTKRLAGASKADRFVGSDLSNYDMRTEDLANHEYKLLGEEEVNGRSCYKVGSKPTNAETEESSGYTRRTLFVDKEWWVPHKILFNDRSGKPLKVMICKEYEKISGLWRSHHVHVKNVQEGSYTTVLYKRDRKINEGIADKTFSQNELKKPPQIGD
ncbi:outer membrane lipoprotein-sorting protein [Planctomycetota bacterium]